MSTGAPNSYFADPSRKRWLALSSAGAFIVLAGFLAPRLLTLPTPTNADTKTETKAPVAAERGAAEPANPSPGDPDLSATLERLLIGTTVVIVVCAGIAWFLRRRSTTRATNGPGLLNVAAALPLPYRCCVFLVEIGDRQWLTGTDAAGIQTVIALPEPTLEAAEEPAHAAGWNGPGILERTRVGGLA